MITLKKDSRQAKIFLWFLKNPMTRGNYKKEDGTEDTRLPEWYIENGTTLCHYFWACFWCPLILVGLFCLFLTPLVCVHLQSYQKYGVPGLFLPSGIIIGLILLLGVIILTCIGADKIGLMEYLKALKEKVCPQMKFIDKVEENNG